MACLAIKVLDNRVSSQGAKDLSVSPHTGTSPDSVECDIETDVFSITVEFNRAEVSMMVGTFVDYMPTMDQVYRFMKSNPLTSAEMLAEIQKET